jgi:RNA polymerase subunit RPABC4/transcription elongation factor Spt4
MSQAKYSSSSKVLFWGLLILCFMAITSIGWGGMFLGWCPWVDIQDTGHIGSPLGVRNVMWSGPMGAMLRRMPLALIYVVVVATLVYRDASKRSMDPWLWAAIATFVPFLIGIVIYLVVRSNGQAECANCGKTIRSDYKVCPYCGKSRELLCAGCRRPVSPDWRVCPYCEASLVSTPDPEPATG